MFQNVAAFGLLMWVACANLQAQALNTVSAQEKKEGWKLLFDGHDLKGWHRYNGKGVPSSWKIEQGVLHLEVPKTASDKPRDGGDLVTDAGITGDFEFQAEFKIEKYTNSGFFFFLQEGPNYKMLHDTGLEVQVGDDALYQIEGKHSHHSGDLFGVAEARIQEPKPLGSWNKVLVTMKKNKLTVLLNGLSVQEHDLTSTAWKQRVAASKLKDAPFSKGKYSGRIGLQDWNTNVWFRNIKWRML